MFWFIVLVLWPLAELYVIVRLSEWIGFIWVLILIVLSWPIGTRLIRAQGRAALVRLRVALASGKPPADEVLDGGLALFGGLLLLVPGFITDSIGILLLVRPTRAVVRRLVARHPSGRWLKHATSLGSWGVRSTGWPRSGPTGRDYDADGTATDMDEHRLEK
ncbi:MAG: FxsA family protein [Solirubrobacteraceae bacterium]